MRRDSYRYRDTTSSYGYRPMAPMRRISSGVRIAFGVLVILGFIAAVIVFRSHNPRPSADQVAVIPVATSELSSPPSPTPSLSPKPTASSPPNASFQSLSQKLQDFASAHSTITWGIEVIDLKTNQRASLNADKSFFAASTNKLVTAIYFLHQVEQGKASLDDAMGSYDASFHLQQLIQQSNNNSWDLFNKKLTFAAQQSYATSLGMDKYNKDENEVSPANLGLLLRKLYRGELLSQEHTKLLLSYMHDTNEERLIPASIPKGTKVFHKYGMYNAYVHDAAIIDNGSPFVLVIMSDGGDSPAYDTRFTLFQQLCALVLPTLNVK